DAGMMPAAVVCQQLPNGRWHVLDELVAEQGTGAERFGEDLGRLLSERYADFRSVQGWADPSAAYGADKERGTAPWTDLARRAAGTPTNAAPTNQLIPRLEAVRQKLSRSIDGEEALRISATCKVLRKGFNSHYRYRRLHVPGSTRWSEEPEKN